MSGIGAPGDAGGDRIRKAWLVNVRGYDESSITFARDAGKARIDVWRRVVDTNSSVRVPDVKVRRHSEADERYPARSPVIDTLTQKELDALLHAFGVRSDTSRFGYRDHYFTDANDPVLVGLTVKGLMRPLPAGKHDNGNVYFIMTMEGRSAALSVVPLHPGDPFPKAAQPPIDSAPEAEAPPDDAAMSPS